MKRILFFILCILLVSADAFAGAAVEARQRQLQRRAAERIAAQRASYQQQIRRQQQQAIQQQQIHQHQRALQQAQVQRAAQMQAYGQARAAQAQAQARAYQQAVNQRAAQQQMAARQRMLNQQVQNQYAAQANALHQNAQRLAHSQIPSSNYNAPPRYDRAINEPDEVSTMNDIWRELEISSHVWPMMMDNDPKLATVKKYLDYFKKKKVFIKKSAQHYVDLVDSMSISNPDLLNHPFEDVLRIVAIMEYDYDIGRDKDQLAQQVLGKSVYEMNKRRLGK